MDPNGLKTLVDISNSPLVYYPNTQRSLTPSTTAPTSTTSASINTDLLEADGSENNERIADYIRANIPDLLSEHLTSSKRKPADDDLDRFPTRTADVVEVPRGPKRPAGNKLHDRKRSLIFTV